MRINVYSQELTEEVVEVSKVSNTGIEYKAVQFVLHSSPMLHHPPMDDDRSAVTFWLPRSIPGLMRVRGMFEEAMNLVAVELNKVVVAQEFRLSEPRYKCRECGTAYPGPNGLRNCECPL